MEIDVYHAEGDLISSKWFHGEPQKGDCFMLKSRLWYVVSRRWNEEGRLEIIVDDTLDEDK